MLYTQSVGLAKNVAYPLKPLFSKAIMSHTGKARSYESKALNETMLPMSKKEGPTNSHPHINQREREENETYNGSKKKKTKEKQQEES